MTTNLPAKSRASKLYRAIRSSLTAAALAAGTVVALWVIWGGWAWVMPKILPYLPDWFTAPRFGWFLAVWMLGNAVLVVILWRKSRKQDQEAGEGR